MENTWLILFIIALFVIALLLYLLFWCRKTKTGKPIITYFPYFPHISFDPTQILLWTKPGNTKQDLMNYIAEKFPTAGVEDIHQCGDCDDSLVVVKNIDANLFLSGQTANPNPSGNPPPKLTGDNGPVYYSPNFPLSFKDPVIKPRKEGIGCETGRIDTDKSLSLDPVTVAVFDTGIDASAFEGQLYQSPDRSCLGVGADEGWNFANHISNWNDDYATHHGSVVGKFIVQEAQRWQNNPVKILPVKVFSSDGACLLSDVLCALQYAKNRGADIINASFGFYAPYAANEDDAYAAATLLFQKFLENYFEGSTMLMIAAAGNQDNENESFVYKSSDPKALRNLDNVSFYPASFAKTIPNIFAVTTIDVTNGTVSPYQNFSANVVDIGVQADAVVIADDDGDPHYVFANPYDTTHPSVEGSSFATPIATGKIAANYYLLKDMPLPVNKEAIRKILSDNALLTTGVAPFETLIKQGTIMNR